MPKISPVLPSAAKRARALQGVRPVKHPAESGTVQVANARRRSAPGKFELVRADGAGFLIRILDGDGAVLALSRTYPDLAAAVEGVEAVRECAATSHISDQTASSSAGGRIQGESGSANLAPGPAAHTPALP